MSIDKPQHSTICSRPTLLDRVLGGCVVLVLPVLLTLLSVRLVMTPLFLQLEYNRPGFPEDIYGFTREDRLEYGPYALNYLFNSAGIEYLGDLTFPDGRPMYNARELRHMEDVKDVTQVAFGLLFWGMIFTLMAVIYLGLSPSRRVTLQQALMTGSILTLSLIGAIVLVAVVAWNTFFDAFHSVFFESGTWRFAYSDTLIRLFPEQFWFDAALIVGVITSASALLLLLLTWRWGSKGS